MAPGLRLVWSWTMASLGGEQCVVFEIPRDRSAADLVRRLASDPRVGSAQVIQTFDQAHRWATGKGVRVAVVDTGVDFDRKLRIGPFLLLGR